MRFQKLQELNGILDFKPGFVGGHCNTVGPYCLSCIAKNTNFSKYYIGR